MAAMQDADKPMTGKTVVITGATSGLGAVAAERLAAEGARIVLVARDKDRAAAAMTRLRAANPAADHTVHFADLSRLAEMKRVGAAIAAAEPRIDVLANNAGAMFTHRAVTEDGLERTFATNHLAYMVMALMLAEPLAAADGARVVNTASAAHRNEALPTDDIQSLHRYTAYRAYGRSKLYNILFTRELARRWADRGITVNSFHPGVVATRFGDEAGGWLVPVIRAVKLFAISSTDGARTLVYLASSPEVEGVTGRYFDKCRVVSPRPAAEDDRAASRLFDLSLKMTGLSA